MFKLRKAASQQPVTIWCYVGKPNVASVAVQASLVWQFWRIFFITGCIKNCPALVHELKNSNAVTSLPETVIKSSFRNFPSVESKT